MFLLIESRDETLKAQRKLEATLQREFKQTAVKNIGYPGGSKTNAKVCTNGRYWYLASDKEADVPTVRLNWFGLFKEKSSLGITVEINTAHGGRNHRVGGFFARNSATGMVYLMHSGRVAGGTKGVSKVNFLAHSHVRPEKVIDASGAIRDGILVMPVEGTAASRPAIWYIDKIAAFKRAARDGVMQSPGFQRQSKERADFYRESRGRRVGMRSGVIDYLSRHGDVVDALESWRKAAGLPRRARLVKNVLIDMGTEVDGQLVEVFEVKTSTERFNLYAAIGQLLVHGASSGCRRVMVLPHGNRIAPDIHDALQLLNIERLNFSLSETTATISPE
jgi:hypothetical protein